MKRSTLPIVGAALGVSALAGYALGIEPYLLTWETPTLFLPRLPEAWDGLRILFLTDPHTKVYGRREERLLTMLGDLPEPPDLILWGGDFLFYREGMKDAERLVAGVWERFPDVPTFAIPGNAEHKLKIETRHRFYADLVRHGVTWLVNRQVPLTLRGETITLAGVDDPYYGHDHLEAALAPVPPCERFTLLLAHSPQIAVRAARVGVDVMLSGHTHGGQVRFPIVGSLKTQNPLSRKMDYGTFDRARMTEILQRDPGGDLVTYISRGIGVARLLMFNRITPRFLCKPEVTLITLRCPAG